MRGLVAIAIVAGGCGTEPRRRVEPAEETEDAAAAVPAPDGVPVALDPGDALVDSVAVDVDEDGDRDLFALLQSIAPPLRVAVLERDGDGYGRPRRIDAGILDEVPDAALEVRSAKLERVDDGFVRLVFRYRESCALAELEQAEVEILWSSVRPRQPALSLFRSYRRSACPGADPRVLETCRPPEDLDRRVRLALEDEGRRAVLSASTGEGAALRLDWQGDRFVQSPGAAGEALEAARRAVERAAAAAPDVALRTVRDALARLDLACPGTGTRSCHASVLGVREEALAGCDGAAERGALHLAMAQAHARAGHGVDASAAIVRAREVGAEAATLARVEREVQRAIAPAPARIVGIVVEAAVPERDPTAAPFVWDGNESIVYTRADGDLGRLIIGQGDQGRLRNMEQREARRAHAALTQRSPSGGRAVVGSDAYGVFVCPTEEEPRRACLEAVRGARREDDEAVCRLVEDRLPDPALVRLTLGPCAGATDPTALGFADDEHVAIVAREAAEPVVVSIADPGQRRAMPPGPSPLYRNSSFAHDGSFRVVSTELGVFKLERDTGRQVRLLPPSFGPESITVSPDGRHFAAIVATGGARIFALP